MLEMVDIEYIRKKHLVEGWSIRKISRNLGVSRQSVRKALNSSEIPKYNLSKAKPCPVMEPYKDIILEWLEQDKLQPKKQRLTAHQIYQQLVAQFEFAGSESTVRRCVRLMKNQTGEVFIPLTADWGEQAQADWGKAKIYLGQTLITGKRQIHSDVNYNKSGSSTPSISQRALLTAILKSSSDMSLA
jgi:transposase